jgi:hypothetical protein
MSDTENLLLALPAANSVDIALKFKAANWPEECMEYGNTAIMADLDKVLDNWRKGVV